MTKKKKIILSILLGLTLIIAGWGYYIFYKSSQTKEPPLIERTRIHNDTSRSKKKFKDYVSKNKIIQHDVRRISITPEKKIIRNELKGIDLLKYIRGFLSEDLTTNEWYKIFQECGISISKHKYDEIVTKDALHAKKLMAHTIVNLFKQVIVSWTLESPSAVSQWINDREIKRKSILQLAVETIYKRDQEEGLKIFVESLPDSKYREELLQTIERLEIK